VKYYADGENAYDMRKVLKAGASAGGKRAAGSSGGGLPPSIPTPLSDVGSIGSPAPPMEENPNVVD